MKSGFVALVGRSNVGKSTLLNAFVGTKVAIITPKPQTTRHAIRGIVHDPRGQIVFVDTPGIFDKSRDPLTESLNREVKNAIEGIDAIVYVADPTRAVGPEENRAMSMTVGTGVKKILVINKCDLSERRRPFMFEYERMGEKFDAVIKISALQGTNLKPILDKLYEILPEGEAYYPEHQFTDMETKKWVEELIREKLFIQLFEEIPYTTNVEIDEMEKKGEVLYIAARVLTTEKRYKKMIIGENGHKIKEIGQSARRELETALQSKIFLDLEVEVDKHWIDREVHH